MRSKQLQEVCGSFQCLTLSLHYRAGWSVVPIRAFSTQPMHGEVHPADTDNSKQIETRIILSSFSLGVLCRSFSTSNSLNIGFEGEKH